MFIIFSKSTVKLLVISINKFGDLVLHEIKIVVRMNSFSSLQYYCIFYTVQSVFLKWFYQKWYLYVKLPKNN